MEEKVKEKEGRDKRTNRVKGRGKGRRETKTESVCCLESAYRVTT
jgi:hypothetical protein